MKRNFFFIVLVLTMLFCCSLPALADELPATPDVTAAPGDAAGVEQQDEAAADQQPEVQLPLDYVTDDAFLLTDEEMYDLNVRATELSDKEKFGVYIITVTNYEHLEMAAGEMENISDCAEALYNEYELGYGDTKDGVLLFISRETEEYVLLDFGSDSFSEKNKSLLVDTFLDAFSAEDWYSGFRGYLEAMEQVLPAVKKGKDLKEVKLHPDIEAPKKDAASSDSKDSKSSAADDNLWIYIVIAAAVIVIAVVAWLLLRKKKQQAKAIAAPKKAVKKDK